MLFAGYYKSIKLRLVESTSIFNKRPTQLLSVYGILLLTYCVMVAPYLLPPITNLLYLFQGFGVFVTPDTTTMFSLLPSLLKEYSFSLDLFELWFYFNQPFKNNLAPWLLVAGDTLFVYIYNSGMVSSESLYLSTFSWLYPTSIQNTLLYAIDFTLNLFSSLWSSGQITTVLFGLKFILLILLLIFVRGGIPRYRYDFLTKMGWFKYFSWVLLFFALVFILYILFS